MQFVTFAVYAATSRHRGFALRSGAAPYCASLTDRSDATRADLSPGDRVSGWPGKATVARRFARRLHSGRCAVQNPLQNYASYDAITPARTQLFNRP
jgi:hypothetical protein